MCCTKPLHNYTISKIFPKHFRNIESDSEYHWLYRMEEKNMLLLVNIKKKLFMRITSYWGNLITSSTEKNNVTTLEMTE